ncbi:MAG: class I SAM-dependent methyltransferase [Spirochaetaceae bacterium]
MIRRFFRNTPLQDISRTPLPFEQEDRLFWAERYISRHVLQAHLDEESEAASRKPDRICAECDWLVGEFHARNTISTAEQRAQHRALDIGCGPGLYSLRLQEHGFCVAGLDISPSSIRYARRHAVLTPGSAKYHHVDYTKIDFEPNAFSLVLCVYGGFGTVSDDTQTSLLRNIYRSLLPGGILVFDIFTKEYADSEQLDTDWHYISRNGFWSPKPHILLERSYRYEQYSAFANAYTTITKRGNASRYLVWHRYYEPSEIHSRLKSSGYVDIAHYADLSGTPWYGGSAWIGIVARKPAEDDRDYAFTQTNPSSTLTS